MNYGKVSKFCNDFQWLLEVIQFYDNVLIHFFHSKVRKISLISIGFGKEMSHLIICVLCTVSVFIIHTKLSVCWYSQKITKKHKLAVNVKLALSMNDGMSRFRFSVYNFCFQRDESLTCIQNILILYTLSGAEKIHSLPRIVLFTNISNMLVNLGWVHL